MLINRWVVEPNPEEAKAANLSAEAMVYDATEDPLGARMKAYKVQDNLAAAGVASQIYHQRHILLTEPMGWKRGHRIEPAADLPDVDTGEL